MKKRLIGFFLALMVVLVPIGAIATVNHMSADKEKKVEKEVHEKSVAPSFGLKIA